MDFKKIMELDKDEQKKIVDSMSKKELVAFCNFQLKVLENLRKKLF